MSLLWIEGWEGFSGGSTSGERSTNLTHLGRKYDNVNGDNFRFVTGHDSSTAISGGRTGAHQFVDLDVSSASEFYISFSVKYDVAFPSGTGARSLVLLESGSEQLTVTFFTDGVVQIKRGATTLLEQTATSTVSLATWYRLEVHIVIGNSGSWSVKLDGSEILAGTGDTQATATAAADRVRLWFWNQSIALGDEGITKYDNFIIQDSAGDFLNSEWYVEGLQPSANGTTNDFTPSAGSNFQNVDDVPADDDTTYNESSVDADVDLYAYDDMTALGAGDSILGLQINSMVKSSAGADEIITVIRSGTTNYGNTAAAVGTSYETHTRLEEQDPDTAAAWTESGVNAAEFGLENNIP